MAYEPSAIPKKGAHLYKHGLVGHPLYGRWRGMIQRCTDPKSKVWNRYGGRGIFVCERWMNFENFLADMGMPEQGQTIDRIDNSKGYCKENCKWVSRSDQMKNRSNSIKITYNGETKNLIDWARHLGIEKSSMKYRLKNWPIEKAFTHQPKKG